MHRGPAAAAERVLAPDLARGFMLLLIALANSVIYMHGFDAAVRSHPLDGTVVDRAVNLVLILLVDHRAYPMFAFLFGYGIVQMLGRQQRAGTAAAEAFRLLRRRNLWILVFGAFHGLLLFSGDILGAYGLCGLLIGWLFIRCHDRVLVQLAGVFFAVTAAFYALNALAATLLEYMDGAGVAEETAGVSGLPSLGIEEPLGALLARLWEWPVGTIGSVLMGVLTPMLLGVLAARHRVLEEPERHGRTLWRTVVIGAPVSLLGGLPLALAGAGAFPVSLSQEMWLTTLHTLSGLGGGLAFAALFGIIGGRLRGRPGLVGTALAATGRRSLTCYLAQSLVFVPLLAAWGLGLGGRLDSAAMAALAVGVWALTVVASVLMERADLRGPAEALLRGRVYRD
ncbi:DUF418 domain-containing protein [Spinactinospora alkalitolerans]